MSPMVVENVAIGLGMAPYPSCKRCGDEGSGAASAVGIAKKMFNTTLSPNEVRDTTCYMPSVDRRT